MCRILGGEVCPPTDSDVLQIHYRDKGLTVHAPAMNPLMFELLRPALWCDAVAESLQLVTALSGRDDVFDWAITTVRL
jgi:hypothetical protein